MSNDLRDPKFTPYKPSPSQKAAQQQNAGCSAALLVVVGFTILIVGIGVTANGVGIGGFMTLIGVFLIGRGIALIRTPQKSSARPQTAARPAPQRPAAKPAPKKKPEAECPNPEPHRHYEAPPRKQEYDTFVVRDKKWPTAQERRLENMKNLYDAGLLTREEYDDEVRKIKG